MASHALEQYIREHERSLGRPQSPTQLAEAGWSGSDDETPGQDLPASIACTQPLSSVGKACSAGSLLDGDESRPSSPSIPDLVRLRTSAVESTSGEVSPPNSEDTLGSMSPLDVRQSTPSRIPGGDIANETGLTSDKSDSAIKLAPSNGLNEAADRVRTILREVKNDPDFHPDVACKRTHNSAHLSHDIGKTALQQAPLSLIVTPPQKTHSVRSDDTAKDALDMLPTTGNLERRQEERLCKPDPYLKSMVDAVLALPPPLLTPALSILQQTNETNLQCKNQLQKHASAYEVSELEPEPEPTPAIESQADGKTKVQHTSPAKAKYHNARNTGKVLSVTTVAPRRASVHRSPHRWTQKRGAHEARKSADQDKSQLLMGTQPTNLASNPKTTNLLSESPPSGPSQMQHSAENSSVAVEDNPASRSCRTPVQRKSAHRPLSVPTPPSTPPSSSSADYVDLSRQLKANLIKAVATFAIAHARAQAASAALALAKRKVVTVVADQQLPRTPDSKWPLRSCRAAKAQDELANITNSITFTGLDSPTTPTDIRRLHLSRLNTIESPTAEADAAYGRGSQPRGSPNPWKSKTSVIKRRLLRPSVHGLTTSRCAQLGLGPTICHQATPLSDIDLDVNSSHIDKDPSVDAASSTPFEDPVDEESLVTPIGKSSKGAGNVILSAAISLPSEPRLDKSIDCLPVTSRTSLDLDISGVWCAKGALMTLSESSQTGENTVHVEEQLVVLTQMPSESLNAKDSALSPQAKCTNRFFVTGHHAMDAKLSFYIRGGWLHTGPETSNVESTSDMGTQLANLDLTQVFEDGSELNWSAAVVVTDLARDEISLIGSWSRKGGERGGFEAKRVRKSNWETLFDTSDEEFQTC